MLLRLLLPPVIGLTLLAAVSTNAQPNEPKKVSVSVEAPAKTEVFLAIVDPLDNNGLGFLRKGDNQIEAGTFVRDINVLTQALYLIKGTEKLRFVRDNTKTYWLLKSGDERRDWELNFHVNWRKAVAPIKNVNDFIKYEFWSVKDPAQREALSRKQYEANIRFLNDYVAKHSLDTQFVSQRKEIFYYERLRLVSLITPKNYTVAQAKQVAGLVTEFANDSALYIPQYQTAAFQVASAIAALGTPKPTMPQRYDAILTNFKGRTRDYLLTKLIGFGMDKELFVPTEAEFTATVNRYMTDCETKSYKDYVSKAILLKNIALKNGNLLTANGQSTTLNDVTANARLTYVDFWASWCGPCREEMGPSKTLQAEYEAKGVQFVYISLDANPGAWQIAANQIGLPDKTSYLLPMGNRSALAKRFGVKSIPHYLLIGQNGRVISANAPRPGTPAIRQLIQANLK